MKTDQASDNDLLETSSRTHQIHRFSPARIVTDLAAYMDYLLAGISSEDASDWFRKVTASASSQEARSEISGQQRRWEQILLLALRLGLSFVLALAFTQAPITAFVFGLIVTILPFLGITWAINRKYALFFVYYFAIIILGVYSVAHQQISFLQLPLVNGILLFCFIAPITLLFLSYLVKVLDRGWLGLLPWGFALVYSLFCLIPIVRPAWWPTHLFPFSIEGLMRVFLTATVTLVGAVIEKTIREERHFPDIHVSGDITVRVGVALYRVLYFFLIVTWELLQDTLKALAQTIGAVIFRIVLPFIGCFSVAALMVEFERLVLVYHINNKYGNLLFIEMIIFTGVIIMFLSYVAFFGGHLSPTRVMRLIRWKRGYALWIFFNRSTRLNRLYVSERYIGLLVYFLLFYPFAIASLSALNVEPYDFYDPLFVGATSIIIFNIILLSIYLFYIIRESHEKEDLMASFANSLSKSFVSRLILRGWLVMLILVGVIAYFQNRALP